MKHPADLICARAVAAVAVVIALFSSASPAVAEPLLAISALGVDPDSADHDQWINLLSAGYRGQRSAVGNTRIDPAKFGGIVLVREVDASSPKLFEAATKGTKFNQAIIDFVSEDGLTYAKLQLGQVSFASYVFAGSDGGDSVPTEELTLEYETISMAHTDRGQTATQEFFFDRFSGESKFSINAPGSAAPSLHLPGTQIGTAGEELTFTASVGDADTPLEKLTLSATSSNPAVLPKGSIRFGGTGGERQVVLDLAAGEIGAVEVEVAVSDGDNSSRQSLLVLVNPGGLPSYTFTLTPKTIAEHSPAGTRVGVLEGSPRLPGPYEMVDSSAGMFRLDEKGGVVVNDPIKLDFERQPRPTIVVRAPVPGAVGFFYGTVEVEVQNVDEGFFDEWRRKHFTPAELLRPEFSGADGDADEDGLKNSVECALDLPPRDGKVPPHAPRFEWEELGGESFLTLRYRQRPAAVDPDTTVIAEHSKSGRVWGRGDFAITVAPGVNEAGEEIEEVSARYGSPLSDEERLMLRLRIQR